MYYCAQTSNYKSDLSHKSEVALIVRVLRRKARISHPQIKRGVSGVALCIDVSTVVLSRRIRTLRKTRRQRQRERH